VDQARTLAAADGSGDMLHFRVSAARAASVPPRSPVLLLHGLASNLTRWSEFVAHTRLAHGRELIRVDLRGHGRSETRRRIGLELWSADLQALLDAIGAPQAILVGHSLGAQAALHFAATQPQRVQALVLIDPVFGGALHGRWRRLARWRVLLVVAAALVRALNRLGLRRRRLAALDLEALDREAREALRDPESEAAFIARYSSAWADLRSFRTAHYLQELAELFRELAPPPTYPMPVLVLLSTGATFAQLAATRAIAAGFARGTIESIDCHHWPLTERPVEVRERIERWIDALEAAPARACGGRRAKAPPYKR
jgi:pimeloyl-ACP methyl ester carboxylesterase